MSNFIIKQAFAEAMDLHKRNQFDEAKQIYKKILSVDSSEPNANHLISLIYTVEGDYKSAKEHIEKAIEKEPNQAIFHSNYGGLLQTMGKSKDAIRAYKKSLKIADSQVASRWGNITEFKGFDLITPNERETRFSLGDQDSTIGGLSSLLQATAKYKNLILKLGLGLRTF